MNDKILKMMLAGLSFGTWPLLLNRSGMTANLFTAMSAMFTFVCVLPFAVGEFSRIYDANWKFTLATLVIGTLGIIIFNRVIPAASKQEVGYLFLIMVLTQISVPAINSIVMNGGFTSKKILGLCCAFAAAILLG